MRKIALLISLLVSAPVAAQTYPDAISTAVEPAMVDDGLGDINQYLDDIGAPPATGSGNAAEGGAFRFICGPGLVVVNGQQMATSTSDPIVFPNRLGDSHEHQFYGNNFVWAGSTYEDLRRVHINYPNATLAQLVSCVNPLNASAYWITAMRNGRGQVVRPDFMSVYYKRPPKGHPACIKDNKDWCRQIPRGLRYVFGYNLTSGGPTTGFVHWDVQGGNSVSGRYADIIEAASHVDTANGYIGGVVDSPDCWDGKNLDSPDHRSHMHDAIRGFDTITQPNDPNGMCPASHPFILPKFTLGTWWKADSTLDTSGTWTAGVTRTWELSSDNMYGMLRYRPGTTLHADWFGAWNDQILKIWTDNCINRLLSCAGGNLGNGKVLRQIAPNPYGTQPRLVPMAPMNREPFNFTVGAPR